MTHIYKITNQLNNKIYIGQTTQSLSDRWIQHKAKAKKKDFSTTKHEYGLYNAINVYGEDSFKIELLEECASSESDAREMYYIEKYNSFMPNGYNLAKGGKGIKGYRFTEEGLKKLSEAQKRIWDNRTPEERKAWGDNLSRKFTGVKKSEAHRKQLSEWAKTRIGEKNSFYGKHHTEEFKQKMREKNLGNSYKPTVKVKCVKEGFEKEFNSYSDASFWLINEGITKSKNRTSITTTIKESIQSGRKRYGFVWYIVE